ncbi:TonB-dependent receptor [Spirosoma rhododendri]|uniref:TonB-dependent siderophore receptor n=1 Tax=Spirosoma rhododendri TaxID=2728024 RepID=A0A7L5DUH3_9BACT|nr:TonB-dependent receptor [Spirosoma rhododendri]QJD79617.1 TonB-dependent siderophore receptor [Spirosoma rhododendri]
MTIKQLLQIVLLTLFSTLSMAQTTIRGVVTDAKTSNTPLAGATITATGAANGTTTDSSGHFELRTAKSVSDVRVSFMGYQPQTVPVTDPNAALTIALAPDDGRSLDEVRVSSRYYRTYTTNSISSALRLRTAPINLSQTIQTITPEVIADQGSFNMTEGVSRNVSGVIRQEVSNNLGPYLFMRGGLISSLRNGIDLTPIYRGPSPDDAAIIERVEFIKGPSLFMNNIGDPAGSFNIVTKQPTGTRRYAATAMLGSFDFYRLAVDLDGQFDKKGKLLYRLNTVGMRTNSFVKFDNNRRFLVAPVLKYRISDRTYVSAEYQYQANSYAMYSPIVMTPQGFGTLPIDFSLTEPSLAPIRARDHTGFLTFAHQVSANWQLTVRASFLRNDAEGVYLWVTNVNPANPNVLLRNPKYDLNRTEVYSQQAFVNGAFTTGGLRHQLLGGIDVNQKRFRADSYVSYDTYKDGKGATQLTYYPLDVTNPNYGAEISTYHTPGGLANGNTSQRVSYESAYLLDELSLLHSKLRLTVAGRFTAARTSNDVSGAHTQSGDNIITPRLGISYSLHPDLSVYALYDRTFVPQAGVTSSGEAVRPLQGVNREIGIKKNWFNGRWNSTLSVYRINRSNIIATDPSNAQYRIQVGQTMSQGVDVDVVGQVARGLNVVVNYAYCDSKIEQDVNPLLVGTPTPMFVKHVQNTWLNYALPAVSGLTVSLGYQYQGGRGERFATATQHTTPDYFRLDGGLGWQHRSLRVNLIVNNLLNRQLIATPWYRNGLYYWVPQPPINGRLTVSYVF